MINSDYPWVKEGKLLKAVPGVTLKPVIRVSMAGRGAGHAVKYTAPPMSALHSECSPPMSALQKLTSNLINPLEIALSLQSIQKMEEQVK